MSYIRRGKPRGKPIFGQSFGIKVHAGLRQLSESTKAAFLNVVTNERLSFRDLYEQSTKLAVHLKSLGYAGKVIGICSENRPDFFVPIIASLYLGSPIVTINSSYSEREILHACGLTKPAALFVSPSVHSQFQRIKQVHDLNYLQQIYAIADLAGITQGINIVDFQPVDVDTKEHVALMLMSSGTTDLPKAVMLTHHNLNALQVRFEDPEHLLSDCVNYLLCLPLCHAYGCNVALDTVHRGITVKFMAAFNEADFLRALEKFSIQFLAVVPPMMVFFAKHPLVDKYNLSSLKTILCAGAHCSAELEENVLRRLKSEPKILQGYGLTESTLTILSRPKVGPPKRGSVGLPDQGVEIKIRDPETNETLGANQVGEICARDDMIMKGYLSNETATRATITPDKWLLTGDAGYFDDDGYFYIVERLKELLKFKGFQVPPAELEALLLTHPRIMDAAVIGVPDDAAGDLPLAFVVRKPGVALSRQEVKDFVKGQTSYAKQLHGGVRFIEEIPKSPSGKILRRKLRSLLTEAKL